MLRATHLALLAGALVFAQPQASRQVVPAEGSRRLALVIGNNAYPQMRLANSINDERGMASVLREAGFQVQQAEDVDLRRLEQSVQSFVGSIRPGDVALFYYSGHGMQIDGENYLIPVSFSAASETDAKYESYSLSRVADGLQERGAALKVMILDACRDNPFRTTRGGARGLASMTGARGSFIAFATDPGPHRGRQPRRGQRTLHEASDLGTADSGPADRSGFQPRARGR
jgi:uncharacterized caspase-like protein